MLFKENFTFGPKLRNAAEAIFAGRKDKPEFIEYEFRDYKGASLSFPSSFPSAEMDIRFLIWEFYSYSRHDARIRREAEYGDSERQRRIRGRVCADGVLV